jgi:hypothetical protein
MYTDTHCGRIDGRGIVGEEADKTGGRQDRRHTDRRHTDRRHTDRRHTDRQEAHRQTGGTQTGGTQTDRRHTDRRQRWPGASNYGAMVQELLQQLQRVAC